MIKVVYASADNKRKHSESSNIYEKIVLIIDTWPEPFLPNYDLLCHHEISTRKYQILLRKLKTP